MSYWSELTRPIPLPAQPNTDHADAGHPDLVRRTSPTRSITTLRGALGDSFTLDRGGLRPMVAQALPAETTAIIRGAPGLTSAPITEDQVEVVRALVARIPASRVSTYGDIAEEAGLSSPRIVAWIMRTRFLGSAVAPGDSGLGRPAPHLATPVGARYAPRACWPTTARCRCASTATRSRGGGGGRRQTQMVPK